MLYSPHTFGKGKAMAHFNTKGKHYREGTDLPAFGALDVVVTASGTTVEQTAPPSLPDAMGTLRSFLYWDTGRRITNKRKVRWTFNHPANWSEWNAVAWYGVPSPDTGKPLVSVDAHWVGVGPIDPTPIDGPGSTFVNGPGGVPLAYPYSGNDHAASTEFGAANIHAKPHLQRHAGDPVLNFSSWTQLIFGGDDSGYFQENDDDISAGEGVTGLAASTSPIFSVPKSTSSVLIAGYVTPGKSKPPRFDRLIELIEKADLSIFIDKGDPSPEDILRLKLISQTLDLVRGERPTAADPFEGLLGASKKMSKAELLRTIAGTKSTLLRGQATLKNLEAMAKKRKGR